MKTIRKTVAQATIEYLKNQYTSRDDIEQKLFAGCFGIFGHGNVAGIGQALNENRDFRYYQCRNEQAMVHTAAAFAKAKNRLSTFVCTSSIGPGATNMVTGAALATINRLPVLLLPGDIFAKRNTAPVLQQIESSRAQDFSVNDCFKPVSKYWDRINRPEQLIMSLPQAMHILTSPAETGAVTLAMPQDVQAESFDFPERMFEKKVWRIHRPLADRSLISEAVEWIRESSSPVIIAGGGVIYSEATNALTRFVDQTGIPVAETMAGKGSLHYAHLSCLGAVGVTGTPGGVAIPKKADLVIGIGTRYSDFTTASNTLFQNPDVRFININISEFDAFKAGALSVVADAKMTLEELGDALQGWQIDDVYRQEIVRYHQDWEKKVSTIYNLEFETLTQGEIIGVVNENTNPDDIMVCASGSLPGDLHKAWRARSPKNFHVDYGYSCMGYEIAGGLGVKMANPDHEVIVMVGDGSYLMLSAEIITSIQEGFKLIIVLINNEGYKSIGSLSRSIGSSGFGTRYLSRTGDDIGDDETSTDQADQRKLNVDLAKNAESLGAKVFKAFNRAALTTALAEALKQDTTTLIYTECDRYQEMDGYAWWDVPIAQVSSSLEVRNKYNEYTSHKKKQRYYNHPKL